MGLVCYLILRLLWVPYIYKLSGQDVCIPTCMYYVILQSTKDELNDSTYLNCVSPWLCQRDFELENIPKSQ